MAGRYLLHALVLLLLYDRMAVAETWIHFYTDASCEALYAAVLMGTNATDGMCGTFGLSINSASSISIDHGCSGMYHTSFELVLNDTMLTGPR